VRVHVYIKLPRLRPTENSKRVCSTALDVLAVIEPSLLQSTLDTHIEHRLGVLVPAVGILVEAAVWFAPGSGGREVLAVRQGFRFGIGF